MKHNIQILLTSLFILVSLLGSSWLMATYECSVIPLLVLGVGMWVVSVVVSFTQKLKLN